eukprot:5554372-Ditylum_brightwellii.AAC.1
MLLAAEKQKNAASSRKIAISVSTTRKTSFSQCSRVDTRRRVRVRCRVQVRALARAPATERVLVYEYQRDGPD